MTQEAFRCYQHQRLAPRTYSLPSQAVEILRGRSRVNHLKIVVRREMEEALHSRARVLRALTLKTVWQKQNQPAQPLPLVFRARDELIHNRLRHVPKVTKLRFPQHQPVRTIQAITILESQHSHLRQRTIKDLDRSLDRPK